MFSLSVLALLALTLGAAAKPLSLHIQEDPCALSSGLEPGDYTFFIDDLIVRSKSREYILHVPANFKSVGANSLIVGLHGMGDTPSNFARGVKLNNLADEDTRDKGVVLAYPKGSGSQIDPTGYTWNGGECCFSSTDDVAFIRRVVEDVASRICIDRSKVFAFGFSAGAVLSNRLAIEANDVFRAFASMSGPLLITPPSNPLPNPVSAVLFHGTSDVLFPYYGSVLFHGAPYTFKNWAKLNGCVGNSEVVFKNKTVTGTAYTDCNGGSTVTLYKVSGMAHSWPSTDISATDVVYNFFMDF